MNKQEAKLARQLDQARNIGWKPRKWAKDGRPTYHNNGRVKPPGPAHTKSPSSLRRKARSLAGRKRA